MKSERFSLILLNHFAKKNKIDVPDMNAHYTRARGRSCR
jgi:hypothetical protein